MAIDIALLYTIFLNHPVISTDTRKITPGCLFFALKGSNFDGNTFAANAIELGAAYAVVDDFSLKGPQFLHVVNTLGSLQALANHHRHQIMVPVLAITGSNGKTTTKELVTCVLSQKYKVHATKGNLNNHIGVPLTLLGISEQVEFVVCEMGANHPGEIDLLCRIAEPTHGLITNIGKAHLEGFGSLEGVKNAKGELFVYLSEHDGFAFVNTDDLNLRELANIPVHMKTYGFNKEGNPHVHFSYSTTPGVDGFTINEISSEVSLQSSMFGHYNASNVLAAYTIGNHFGVSNQQIQKAIADYTPGANRSEILKHNACIIVKDAYNANPSSMELAIRAFSAQYPSGWVVLGDMKELGVDGPSAHHQIIELVVSLRFEQIFLVGKMFSEALIHTKSSDTRFVSIDNIHSLKKIWNWKNCRDKAILLKGSRSMQLELLLEDAVD
jgi:UDP-N-acetylmuramoyl-tripeptide--D-alanyl-D-alanine ligase